MSRLPRETTSAIPLLAAIFAGASLALVRGACCCQACCFVDTPAAVPCSVPPALSVIGRAVAPAVEAVAFAAIAGAPLGCVEGAGALGDALGGSPCVVIGVRCNGPGGGALKPDGSGPPSPHVGVWRC